MMMGTKSLFMLKSHIDSINLRVVNDFVCVNMLWAFASLRVFVCNYVFYAFGMVLRYLFRFLHLGDAKDDIIVQKLQVERNRVSDSEIDGFREELASFLFWSENFHEETEGETESHVSFMEVAPESERRDGETECSAFSMEIAPESEKRDVETDCSVFMGTHCDAHEDEVKTEVPTESSVSEEIESDIREGGMSRGIEEEGSVFMKSDSENSIIHENSKKVGKETGELFSMETNSDVHQDGKTIEDEIENFVYLENDSGLHPRIMKREEEEEMDEPVSAEIDSVAHEEFKKIDENETGSSVLMENVSSETVNDDGEKIDENEDSVFEEQESNVNGEYAKREEKEEEEETNAPVFGDSNFVTTTSKCEYLSGKDISGFMEEPTTLRFSFREFYMGPDVSTVSDNVYASTKIIADKEFSEFGSEKKPLAQAQTEDSVQEEVSTPSTHIPLHFESEMFGGSDSSDEDYFLYNENSVTSDSESESSSSSGLNWGNSNKMDDSIVYQFLGGKNGGEGFQTEILKLMMREERAEDVEEKHSSFDGKASEFSAHGIYSKDGYVEMEPCMKGLKSLNAHGFGGKESKKAVVKDQREGSKNKEEEVCRNGSKRSEEIRWEDELSDSESDEGDFEWEHNDLVEQLKLELKNSRQGGLATILEEEEEADEEEEVVAFEEEERVSPRVVEDPKPVEIEEKLEYKDQIDEIDIVYKSYAEKMKQLDILNYQTLHALGLLQLKDPLKLISLPKSAIQGAKPVIPQNLWPRKASKISSDPLVKFVHELHRDLELVYVGQVCLSWEILCWQHKKALELQKYDSQGSHSHRYNHVAGEFQLFQVLVQRFIENEPFQGPRLQNYVKNRCVIRNLLQVPGIKDDSKGDEEEDAIASGKLADIIKESMRVFWEFVRADKDYGNVIFKASQHNIIDLKDPIISGLMLDIKTQLQKKDRKLKDIVRTGNCIVKKFQKHHEDQLDHEQLVAQVGLRLISRVVNMSKLRKEQLIWCNEKLHRIKFLSRKIVQVEPSFLLFPC